MRTCDECGVNTSHILGVHSCAKPEYIPDGFSKDPDGYWNFDGLPGYWYVCDEPSCDFIVQIGREMPHLVYDWQLQRCRESGKSRVPNNIACGQCIIHPHGVDRGMANLWGPWEAVENGLRALDAYKVKLPPVTTLDEVQERVPVEDPYMSCDSIETDMEQTLGELVAMLHNARGDLHAIRMGCANGIAHTAYPMTLADFRREAPALLAELVKEVAKL